jgi:hypothetical protein
MKNTHTKEFQARKISFSKAEHAGASEQDSVMAWEYAPPTIGERYLIYLGKGRLLRTSPVKNIRESHGILWIETANSTYRVKYVD